jgi:hypothetical protein
MRKALFSFLAVIYVFLMLSASFGSLYFEDSKTAVQIDWSDCQDVSGDNEEPTTEDSREFDENVKMDFLYSLQKVKPNSNKSLALCLHLNRLHFPEIDSPPPQA